MLYQTIKFYFARLTVSLFMVVAIGFSFLYFVHEVALPNVVFNDVVIQWAIFLICIFFGFVGYGMLGEQRFYNCLYELKNISPESIVDNIKVRFEDLIKFTYSSYFLPTQGKNYRNIGVLQYADYLLSIGDESPSALNIYVQALIQGPQNTRFKKPLLSILNRGETLNQHEMDLLLIMFQKEEKRDPVLISYLAQLFLKAKQWSGQTEPIFLDALNEKNKLSEDIIQFVLPIYLAHNRTDVQAIRFYYKALEYSVPEEKQIKSILGQLFCDGNLIGIDPDLHRSCEQIFSHLDKIERAQLKSKSDETKVSYKLKKVKLFRKEDLKDLKRLKIEMGLVASKVSVLWKGLKWFAVVFKNFGRWFLIKVLDIFYRFGRLSLRIKLGSFVVISILVVVVIISQELSRTVKSNRSKELFAVSKSSKVSKKNSLYTVQIAAFLYKKQAKSLMVKLMKKKVKDLYLEKSRRNSAAGYWYKVRAGKFSSESEARDFANRMVAATTVKNYFIISLPKK